MLGKFSTIISWKIFSVLFFFSSPSGAPITQMLACLILSQRSLKRSGSRSAVSDSLQPHGVYSPWNSPGQNTGVGSHCFSRESSQPRDWTQVSHIAGDSLPAEPPGKPKILWGYPQFFFHSSSFILLFSSYFHHFYLPAHLSLLLPQLLCYWFLLEYF